jgi:hypothetical protein
MEVSGQRHASAALPPEKEPAIPIGYEAGWAAEQVLTLWSKVCWPCREFNSSRPARRYTDWSIRAPVEKCTFYGTQKFIMVATRAHHWVLSGFRQSDPHPHAQFLRIHYNALLSSTPGAAKCSVCPLPIFRLMFYIKFSSFLFMLHSSPILSFLIILY